VAARSLDDPGRDRPAGREGLVVAQEVVLVSQVADACAGPGAPASSHPGCVGFGGDLLRGPRAVAGQHGEGPGRDPVLGGGVPGRVEAPCSTPQILENVNYVDNDMNRDAPAGGLGADEIQLAPGPAGQNDPGAQVLRVAGLATGAHILWRAPASFTLKPVKVLQDGTYLAELKPPRKKDGPAVTVRVIEYTVHTVPAAGGQAATSELFCLVTDLLDPQEYPAPDLACCYPDRWGCETVIGRHKTDMGEGQPVLRSKDPAGAAQEMWALFSVYQALCKLAGLGAHAAGIPPSRISFPHVLQAATDTVAAFPPDQEDLALATFLLKILLQDFAVASAPSATVPGNPRRPETSRPASPASPPSPTSPATSSSTRSNHG
jgi:hypothetical protein